MMTALLFESSGGETASSKRRRDLSGKAAFCCSKAVDKTEGRRACLVVVQKALEASLRNTSILFGGPAVLVLRTRDSASPDFSGFALAGEDCSIHSVKPETGSCIRKLSCMQAEVVVKGNNINIICH
jgi:hypothetical protein